MSAPIFSRAALVAVWGDNTYGQTRLPVGVNNIKAISGGEYHNLALRSDGSVVAWGLNNQGQINVPAGLANVKAIAARGNHCLTLKVNGTVVAWGSSFYGLTNVPDDPSGVTAIACGALHNLVLKADGTVIAWGNNSNGETNVPAGLSDAIAIAAGANHSLALKADGSVVAWGVNSFGQATVPSGLSNVVAITAGNNFNLALKADGTIVAWGQNQYGQSNVPLGLSNVTAIAAGVWHALALTTDGTVVAWGDNTNGQLALPSGLSHVTAIAAGGYHNLALVPDGPVQILQNPQSQGIPYTSNTAFSVVATGSGPLSYQWYFNRSPMSSSPAHVSGTTDATLNISNAQFSDIGTYTVIVSNAFGSVISSGAMLTVISPPFITSQSPDQTVGAGTFATLSVTADGTPPLSYQWTLNGTNLPGRTLSNLFISNVQPEASGDYTVMVSNPFGTASATLGLVVTNRSPIITQQPFITTTNLRATVTSPVPPGSSVALNVSATGSLPLRYQWRFNGVDLLGATNTTLLLQQLKFNQSGFYNVEIQNAFGATNSAKLLLNVSQVAVAGVPLAGNPNMPLGLSDVTALAAGGSHVLALKTDGTVRTWLVNTNYIFDQAYAVTNVPSSATNVIAIAAGRSHCLALRSNGTVLAWGPSTGGQTNVPTSLSNVIAIAAGWSRSYAVKAEGTVTGWGSSATVPAGLSNVVAVAAGPSQNLALRRDGTVAFWTTGSFTAVPGLSNAIAIAASSTGNRALRQDGTVVSWPASSVAQPVPVLEGQYPVSNAVAIAVGSGVSLVLKQGGTLVTSGFEKTLFAVTSNLIAIAAGGVQSGFGVMLVGNGTPAITLHPYSQIVQRSNTVQLHARAAGVQPMSYQWQLENQNLPGATNASLLITNAQGRDTGNYRMLVSNPLDTVASRIAALTIPYNTNLAAALNYEPREGWTTGLTNRSWFAQNRETHDGDVAAQSGPLAHNQESPLQTTFSGRGTVTFWWKVSSEEGFDVLRAFVDQSTTPLMSISGETGWEPRTITFTNFGNHTVRWVYTKDGSVSTGRDAGWLDEVAFTPAPPTAYIQPASQTVSGGKNASFFAVTASEVKPVTFQWLRFGTNIPGATNQTLMLSEVGRKDRGSYSVRVGNAGGSITTSNATLRVNLQQRLGSAQRRTDGSMEIFSQDADGGALSSLDLPLFEAQATTNLVHWQTLPDVLSVTNGSLLLRDDDANHWPQRFYRIVEH